MFCLIFPPPPMMVAVLNVVAGNVVVVVPEVAFVVNLFDIETLIHC